MKVAIYGQYQTKEAVSYIKILMSILAKKNITAVFEDHFYELIKEQAFPTTHYSTFKSHQELDESFEVMLTVGGDGTFLRAVTFVRDRDIPILGINIGRLGFLATVQKEHIEKAINLLISKKYVINERSLLSINIDPSNEFEGLNFAINEIAVSRKNTTSMITIETYLNNEYLTSYWADGLIIATPTGSTGYSLSCGGPILAPDTQSLVITPIAPHNLNARPLVISDTTELTLKIVAREKEALLSLDSRTVSVDSTATIRVKKADFKIKTILLHENTFFKTLREKLLWGEDKRN
ncbi:NAD kinase [Flavobacteriaceae bacterium F08102]|nr:NAD kinase [Flavobacteriaceae bacterium F08102]